MNIKKAIMLILVCFGPLSFFYFLSKGEYHFKKLPFLHDSKEGKPDTYNSFTLYDQEGKTITPDSLKNKLVIVNYMDRACPYDCKIDGKMMKLIVYKEIMDAPGFKDVVIITEVNDSTPAARKRIQESLDVNGKRWKFVYSKDFSFFNASINKSNPYLKVDKKYVDGKVFERSVLLLDKELRIRAFLDNSADIEFKRLNEELRLLKKEYSKKKTVI
jgi:cytochrome oxidase Cu insertion factor (SCO1/SenC/PrrC family)